MTPTTPIHVYAAINAVQLAMSKEGIAKGRKNQAQGYTFRGIDDVYSSLSPYLAENKLCILPRVIERGIIEKETKTGSTLFYTTLKVEFDFVSAVDGSKHTVCTVGEAMDTGDKSSNKAMSAAYKYAAFMAFCIPTEGDNDADGSTHEPAAKSPVKAKETAPLGQPVVALANKDQTSELSMLYLDGCADRIKAALVAYKADTVEKLTEKQAAAVLKKLNEERAKTAFTA